MRGEDEGERQDDRGQDAMEVRVLRRERGPEDRQRRQAAGGFLRGPLSRARQADMPGGGRTLRRKTARFWEIWPMPPKVEAPRRVVFVDGIHLGRRAVVLVASDESRALGWHLCRSENSRAWAALISRVAAPEVVVSDGGDGFAKALGEAWPGARHQRCVFHAFCQVRHYTTASVFCQEDLSRMVVGN